MQGNTPANSLKLWIPDGDAGTRETLKHMRQLARDGKDNLLLRRLANGITAGAGAKDWESELEALFNWVRANVRYSLDPNDMETIQGPAQTVALGFGDCDDFCVLLGTLCELTGHPACFVALEFGPGGGFSHVVVIASGAGETEWICLDATEANPFGWFPPDATRELICPISETAAAILTG